MRSQRINLESRIIFYLPYLLPPIFFQQFFPVFILLNVLFMDFFNESLISLVVMVKLSTHFVQCRFHKAVVKHLPLTSYDRYILITSFVIYRYNIHHKPNPKLDFWKIFFFSFNLCCRNNSKVISTESPLKFSPRLLKQIIFSVYTRIKSEIQKTAHFTPIRD